jgi:hypothetical protein
VCGQFVCKRSFKYPHTKRCRTVRSGDLTDHGISDTWKCSSSVISMLHTPPIYCHWKVLKWHDISFSVCRRCPYPHRGARVRSEACQSALSHAVQIAVFMAQ